MSAYTEGKLQVKLYISENANKLKQITPSLFPTGKTFVDIIGKHVHSYLAGIIKEKDLDKLLAKQHYIPELCCVDTKGTFDLDLVLNSDELGGNSNISKVGQSRFSEEVISKNFVFEITRDSKESNDSVQ